MRRARLLISCPDRAGIVAAVSGFLHRAGANILDSDQHSTDPAGGVFYMRMEFDVSRDRAGDLERGFGPEVAGPLDMRWRLRFTDERPRMAILASREEHCLLELLWRRRRGEIDAEVTQVISNHVDAEADAYAFGVPFVHLPVPPGGKPKAEERLLELLADHDLVVLARYMQILSPEFLAGIGAPIINIHHSFLPAFVGADPYGRAYERGVKLIGATAHYVTEELDAGPIIEQDVERVSHRLGPDELRRVGRDIERSVLARAVDWHLGDRVLVHENKTIVF
ncbi:MAG: formyltetrahydrofolate deformylase [Solirubrobacterales bacterium]